MTSLSAYEQLREANIKRNEEFLSSIGLAGSADQMRSQAQASKPKRVRGAGPTSRKAQAAEVVVRRSGRVTLERVRVELESLAEDDPKRAQLQIDLETLSDAKKSSSFVPAISEAGTDSRMERMMESELSAEVPTNLSDEEGKGWSTLVSSQIAPLSSSSSSSSSKSHRKAASTKSSSSPSSSSARPINKLAVAEEDVAKLTDTRITSVFVHSSESALLCAAGDKIGNLGLWLVNEKGENGIYKFRPHSSNICRIWAAPRQPSRIMTGSYDGTIRCLDLDSAKPSFVLKHCSTDSMDDMYYTDVSESKNSNVLFASRSDCNICAIDTRQPAAAYAWLTASRVEKGGSGVKMNSVQEHPHDSNTLLAAGAGGSVVLFDLRKTLAPVRSLDGHTKSVNAAYFSPSGDFIVSVGQDDSVRTWSNFLGATPLVTVTRHDNHTGRWLSTFRPAFHPTLLNTFVLGSMDRPRKINVWECSDSAGKPQLSLVSSIKGDYVGSVCSRNAFHPTLNIIAGANSSGRVHIAR